MRPAARIGFAILLVSGIMLAPFVMAAECNKKNAGTLADVSQAKTTSVIDSLTTSRTRGAVTGSGSASR